jgi:hypothetical protein
VELLPERKILEDELVMSPAGQRQRADEEKDHLKHACDSVALRAGNQPSVVQC